MTTQPRKDTIQDTLSDKESEAFRKASTTSDASTLTSVIDSAHADSNKQNFNEGQNAKSNRKGQDLKSKVDAGKNQNGERKLSAAQKSSDGVSSDGSGGSNMKKKFVKVKAGGAQDHDSAKPWDEDINYSFAQDKENFVGQFQTDEYQLIRGYLEGSGVQLRLYYNKLEPFGDKLATLCIVHGLGEHCGRYMEMADHFAKQGFVVHMLDLRGFGQSGYPRANATLEELHKDIEVLLRQASKNLPLFIYCHSMGCGLTASLLMRNPYLSISGVIFTSGLFGFPIAKDMNWGRRNAVKFMSQHLGEVVLNIGINPTALSRNNFNVRKLFDDRLCIPIVGMTLARTLVDIIEYSVPNAHQFTYPCLIIHGNADTVTNCSDSVRFYKKVISEDKTLKIFDGGYHELQYDTEKELLKKIMSDWLLERANKSPRNFSDMPPLKVGLPKRTLSQKLKILVLILLAVFYFVYLKRFRGHKLYSTSFRTLFYPLFYIKNVLLKKHGWRI